MLGFSKMEKKAFSEVGTNVIVSSNNEEIHSTTSRMKTVMIHIKQNDFLYIISNENSRGRMAETSMDPIRSQPMKKLNLFIFLWFCP